MNEPLWWQVLNLDSANFERSKYAAPLNEGSPGKFRLKDPTVLQKLAPGLYQAIADEVQEENEILIENQGSIKKGKIGRKLGSIPFFDYALRPELSHDPKAREQYWRDNPQFKYKPK